MIPGLGKSSGERNGYSLQYSCLENPMDRGAWRATVQEITKRWTQLRTNTFTSFLILQNSAPPHPKFFSLAPRVSTTVPVMGLFGDFHWRRKWQSTPALLPGKSHGWRSLLGYSPWGHKESDTTERLSWHAQVVVDFRIIQCMVVPRVNALTYLASLSFYCSSVLEERETRPNVYPVPRICQAL